MGPVDRQYKPGLEQWGCLHLCSTSRRPAILPLECDGRVGLRDYWHDSGLVALARSGVSVSDSFTNVSYGDESVGQGVR